jgi:hypothetical protein
VSTASALEITLKFKIIWAVSYVSHSRSGTGRHGGRPSQEPDANAAAVPDDAEVVPPKCQKRIPQRYRTTRRSSLPNARNESRSGTGRHGGRPSQKPQSLKPSPKKLCASAPLREITVPAKPPPIQDCLENPTANTVASGLIPRFVALSPGVKPVATNLYPQRTIF